ncbi:MAG: hypothetical protein V1735_07570 [Nanoarchaeota archaeon]
MPFDDNQLSAVALLFQETKESTGLPEEELLALLRRKGLLNVPLSIFNDRRTGMLEAVSQYLHDERKLTFQEIAVLLNRDHSTIWTSYHNAKRKK